MKCILKFFAFISKLIVFIAGIAVLLKLAFNKLEKMGIIKTEWIVQKTPANKGVRWAMSFKDKVFLSFQL
ncbi:MAG: hypothetical protein UE295_09090 [Acutalibacteraceae bacterium]|nr:hypothetical protein [Acutalibacteraceae bacterium]